MNRQRFLVKSFGDNIEGTNAGLFKLLEILNTGNCKNATIVVPSIGQAGHTMLIAALGEELSKALIKNRFITFSDGKKLSLCGQATLKNFRYEDAYLGLWASGSMITEIEALPTWKSLVVVTWLPADSEQWLKEKNVTVIYDDGKG